MTRVLGVDGGGTRTRALLVDDDGIPLGRGEGPAGIVGPEGADAAARAVEAAARGALAEAGSQGPVDVLWAGLAGAGSESRRRAARSELETLGLARRVAVGTDVEAAFRDAFSPGESGILLVAGTGSIALGRRAGGPWIRVGGWGALLGDEGSGYRLGLEAARSVLRGYDGRAPGTDLRDPVLDAFGLEAPPELVDALAGVPKARIATLAEIVADVADRGDATAGALVDDAVAALLAHVEGARRRLGPGSPPPVALAGGLAGPGRPLRPRLEAGLRGAGHRVPEGTVRAERGAALLGLRLAHVSS